VLGELRREDGAEARWASASLPVKDSATTTTGCSDPMPRKHVSLRVRAKGAVLLRTYHILFGEAKIGGFVESSSF